MNDKELNLQKFMGFTSRALCLKFESLQPEEILNEHYIRLFFHCYLKLTAKQPAVLPSHIFGEKTFLFISKKLYLRLILNKNYKTFLH